MEEKAKFDDSLHEDLRKQIDLANNKLSDEENARQSAEQMNWNLRKQVVLSLNKWIKHI